MHKFYIKVSNEMHVHNNIKILPIKNKPNNSKHVICQLYTL